MQILTLVILIRSIDVAYPTMSSDENVSILPSNLLTKHHIRFFPTGYLNPQALLGCRVIFDPPTKVRSVQIRNNKTGDVIIVGRYRLFHMPPKLYIEIPACVTRDDTPFSFKFVLVNNQAIVSSPWSYCCRRRHFMRLYTNPEVNYYNEIRLGRAQVCGLATESTIPKRTGDGRRGVVHADYTETFPPHEDDYVIIGIGAVGSNTIVREYERTLREQPTFCCAIL